MTAKISVSQNGIASVSGDLTFSTVTALCEDIPNCFQEADIFKVDLSGVKTCDSASLVLLVMIIRFFTQQQKNVVFTKLPATILTLIKLYNLKNLITVN